MHMTKGKCVYTAADFPTVWLIFSHCGTFSCVTVHLISVSACKKEISCLCYIFFFFFVLLNLQSRMYPEFSNNQTSANSEDPDQTPRSAASDQGLHCLPLIKLF